MSGIKINEPSETRLSRVVADGPLPPTILQTLAGKRRVAPLASGSGGELDAD